MTPHSNDKDLKALFDEPGPVLPAEPFMSGVLDHLDRLELRKSRLELIRRILVTVIMLALFPFVVEASKTLFSLFGYLDNMFSDFYIGLLLPVILFIIAFASYGTGGVHMQHLLPVRKK